MALAAATLQRQGLTGLEIARRLRIGSSHAYSLLNDPTGERDKERKRSYAGVCVDCGGETWGGAGERRAPKRCASCAEAKRRSEKFWTRERVIAAIRLFAERNGRPPTAREWQQPVEVRGADYPPASQVYRTRSKASSPFASWADAIEAAGFPRPTRGRRLHGSEV